MNLTPRNDSATLTDEAETDRLAWLWLLIGFALLPFTAWQFAPGNQIRLTIAFADAGNFDTPVLDPAPTVHLLRHVGHPAYVEIPTLPVP